MHKSTQTFSILNENISQNAYETISQNLIHAAAALVVTSWSRPAGYNQIIGTKLVTILAASMIAIFDSAMLEHV